ncbi:hypothetical protein M3603_09520 [Rummeliibacillus stabekisii]|nr:hypothetical protein [Rummeliibacillus stabekisii]MCM3316904.1 hypothetical protein [Rummeliibacillus stabekisii]
MSEWRELNEDSKTIWEQNAKHWDEYMGNESNRFHQELIRPYTEKLLKVKDINTGNIKFNPIFYTEVKELQPFIENNETTKIKLWDLKEEIDLIDSVDINIFKYLY